MGYSVMSQATFEFDSPIEFVVVGPVDGRDAVLAKSKGAGIDLVGMSIGAIDEIYSKKPSDFLSSLFPRSRQLQSVKSSSIFDIKSKTDRRTSDLTFSWVGAASSYDINKIEHLLSMQSREIAYVLSDRLGDELEISLAPVVLECSRANERRSRLRRLLVAATILYIAVGILSTGFASLAYFTQHFFH